MVGRVIGDGVELEFNGTLTDVTLCLNVGSNTRCVNQSDDAFVCIHHNHTRILVLWIFASLHSLTLHFWLLDRNLWSLLSTSPLSVRAEATAAWLLICSQALTSLCYTRLTGNRQSHDNSRRERRWAGFFFSPYETHLFTRLFCCSLLRCISSQRSATRHTIASCSSRARVSSPRLLLRCSGCLSLLQSQTFVRSYLLFVITTFAEELSFTS